MDGDIKKDILDVRKVIERSTSKVSLRDLEKKGFRKVKVLRAGDINQLIYKAVQTVLAKQPAGMGEAERNQILNEAKAEYEAQTKRMQQLQETQERIEGEKAEVQAKAEQVEAAKGRLEEKVKQLNDQLVAERNRMQAEKAAFLEEKKQLEREKQSLYEKGFDAVRSQQQQVQELQLKLNETQHKLEQAVSHEQYNQLHTEARERVAGLEKKLAEVDAELQTARASASASSMGKVENSEIERIKSDQAEMFSALLGAIKESQKAAPVAAQAGGDFEKSFKSLQQSLTDQLRKMAGSGMRGGGDDGGSVDVSALLAAQASDDRKLETNIKDVNVKEQSAAGVKDKLSKLRNMRSGGSK